MKGECAKKKTGRAFRGARSPKRSWIDALEKTGPCREPAPVSASSVKPPKIGKRAAVEGGGGGVILASRKRSRRHSVNLRGKRKK